MKTKDKGDRAVAQAIAYYTDKGDQVLLPFGDRQKYDLVVDDGIAFRKVQCKYSSVIKNSGTFEVSLRTMGGNQSFHTATKYKAGDFDLLFAMLSDGRKYEIPASICLDRNSITLGGNLYSEFEIMRCCVSGKTA